MFNAANQLLEDDNACYAYDANGNRVRAQAKVSGACTGTVTEYVYDPENRLIEVIEAGATIARYRYDALGRRIEKVTAAGTRRYVYDREDIFLEYRRPSVRSRAMCASMTPTSAASGPGRGSANKVAFVAAVQMH